ncbi:MAG TPA: FAD binding domain-containing protein [Spirochaetia bacterium]|nr:FAD binding domain-containing protein [Spirochaetia bacterium]
MPEERKRISRSNIYTPTSLAELLSLYSKLPSALIYSGGTQILREQPTKYLTLPANVINIHRVQELGKISRTERHLDIGATVPIGAILEVGANVIPRVLGEALATIGTPAIRNSATLGGNLCIPDRRMSTFSVYLLLDMHVELRKTGSTRWIPLNRFAAPDRKIDLQRGEVLTRVRIPFATWDTQLFKRIDGEPGEPDNFLSFCGLARVQRDVITDIRIACATSGTTVIRSREIETELVGRKVPVAGRELASIHEIMKNLLDSLEDPLSAFQRQRIQSVFAWFLNQLTSE